MNDSVPPPDGHTPQSWRNPGVSTNPMAAPPPVFDPRRAMGGAAAHPHHGTHPVMAPPPVLQDNLAHTAPSPYVAPSPYAAPSPYGEGAYGESSHDAGPYDAAAPYPGHAAQQAAPQAAPPYPGQHAAPNPGYTPGHYDQNYGGQPAYDYAQVAVVEPAGGRASLMSRLTGRGKRDHSLEQHHDQGPENGPATANARKPFLMGLLTGVVVMLILGQVFRAAQPSADYAQALPPPNMADALASNEPEVVAFLDTVEGLN